MRKENASFETKFISEAGSYLNNADYFAFVELKDYACYVIADGIDTDDMKKSAQQAVTAVIAKFSDMPGMSKAKLKSYMAEAHRTLPSHSGLQTVKKFHWIWYLLTRNVTICMHILDNRENFLRSYQPNIH